MPNSDPPASSASRLEERADRGRGRLAVDMLLFGALLDPRETPGLGRVAGALKLYLAPTTGIEEAPPETSTLELLAGAARTGLAVTVHAEDPGLFGDLRLAADPEGWSAARPLDSEECAVTRLLEQAPPGIRLHVAHVTSAEVAVKVRAAGHSCEVTPHHLLLSARSADDARFKVNPPLRSESTRARLWAAFLDGTVGCIASDHAPHPAEEKRRPFAQAPAGMPGVGTLLPLLLARARHGELPLGRLVSAACERPARWLGLPCGRLLPGHSGGVLVVDFRRSAPFHPAQLAASCGWSAFEGREMIFPTEHWQHGERIVEAGEYTGRPNGRLVRPEYARTR